MASKHSNFKAIIILAMLLSFIFPGELQAEVGYTGDSVEATVVAPGGLSEKERDRQQKEYTYEVRQKDRIVSPYVDSEAAGDVSKASIEGEWNEQERLYRYFGVAADLRKEGKLEESVEILEYIVYVNPTDNYVRSYLDDVKKDLKNKNYKWDRTSAKDAEKIKKEKVKNLTIEGKAYYKQKQYDMALVRFTDILEMEPKNSTAKSYINMLKKHYLKQIQAESIVKTSLEETSGSAEEAARPEASNGEDVDASAEEAAGKLLDENEIEAVMEKKKTATIMDQVEMEMMVEDIIAQHRVDEERARFYQLGPGDIVEVSVRDHPELSGQVRVGVNGDLAMPLTNDVVRAVDLTVNELTEEVTIALEKYIDDPNVSISILGYYSKLFYVIDEGGVTPYPITRANFRIKDALFTADWGNNRALRKVRVVTPSMSDPIVKVVNAYELIYKGDLTENIKIADGDIIYVPLTIARKMTDLIRETLAPMSAANDLRSQWLDGRWNMYDGWANIGRIPRNRALQGMYRSQSGTAE